MCDGAGQCFKVVGAFDDDDGRLLSVWEVACEAGEQEAGGVG